MPFSRRYPVAVARGSLSPGGPKRARSVALCVLAPVAAALGLVAGSMAATAAAHYGAGASSGSNAISDQAAGPNAVRLRAQERAPRLWLAHGGGNPFVALLKGLFGMEPRSKPHRLQRPERRLPRRALTPSRAPAASAPEGSATTPGAETYRTVCVRLCDGYYWPVRFATTRETFERDARTCAQSCNGSTALYYYPNPGGAPDDMVNLGGLPYRQLGTAFLYRITYDANCKCRPHPWETQAASRHKSYAKGSEVRGASRGARRGP